MPSERYLEDYEPGEVFEFGDVVVTEDDIIDFATRYDPQPFHVNPQMARDTIYGGLIASGWQTAGLMMRMLVDHFISPAASLGSPGIDELRWLKPVRPGDRLRCRTTVTEARRSRSKPDRGLLHTVVEVLNQEDEVVMTVKSMGLYRCRTAG